MDGVDFFGSNVSGGFVVPNSLVIEHIIKYCQSTHFVVIGQTLDNNCYKQIKAAYDKKCFMFIGCSFTDDASCLFMLQENLKVIFCSCVLGKGCRNMFWDCKNLKLYFIGMNAKLSNGLVHGNYHTPIARFIRCMPINVVSRTILTFSPVKSESKYSNESITIGA